MLLIVDDEKPTREGLRAALEDRYEVYVAEDAAAAIALLEQENFDVLLTDFRLPNEDGMKLITRAKSLSKPPVCILMTAYGSEELAVQAMKSGADDYIAKGRLQIDELEMRIARALRGQKLERENVALRQQMDTKFGLENIIGESDDAGSLRPGAAGCPGPRRHGADPGRKRDRQGADRKSHSSDQSAIEAADGDGALRGALGDAA